MFLTSKKTTRGVYDAVKENNEGEQLSQVRQPLLYSSVNSVTIGNDSVLNALPQSDPISSEAVQFFLSKVLDGKRWYDLLKKHKGLDVDLFDWMTNIAMLAEGNYSEFIMSLAHSICLAKHRKCVAKIGCEENKTEDAKNNVFDSQKILALFEVVSCLVEKADRKMFVQFVCEKSELQILEIICKKESMDRGYCGDKRCKFPWKGEFTGFITLTELLQYVLYVPCCSSTVVSIAKKLYGRNHNLYNGRQYTEYFAYHDFRNSWNKTYPTMKECLKRAMDLRYNDVVLVMLSGDIFHCIRLLSNERFQQEKVFREALDVIRATVAEIICSLIIEGGGFCKNAIKNLLEEGIEIDIEKIRTEDLIDELQYREIKLTAFHKSCKQNLIHIFRNCVGDNIKLKLRKTIVGALISSLCFEYQDELVAVNSKKPFILNPLMKDKYYKKEQISQLNRNIDNTKFVEDCVLKFIKMLNSCSHELNNWLFREVLERVVNDNWEKLKAVCSAICKEPMLELIENTNVHAEVVDILKLVGVAV